MPARSAKQMRYMQMCLHNPSKAYKKCPPKKVAREFATKVQKAKRDNRGYFK